MRDCYDDEDSFIGALADWFIVGLYTGLRKAEWAQPDNKQKCPSKPELDIFGNTRAFVITDIEFETVSRWLLRGIACLFVLPNNVRKVWVTFWTQKNGVNGERRMFRRTNKQTNKQTHGLLLI